MQVVICDKSFSKVRFPPKPAGPQARSPALSRRNLLDMAAEEGGAAAEPNVWRGQKVPPDVFAALTTRWRGQSGIAKKQVEEIQ